MIIYLSIFLVIVICSLIWEKSICEWMVNNYLDNKKTISELMPWLLVLGYISFLAAMRSGINDTGNYVQSFNAVIPSIQAIRNELANFSIQYSAFTIAEILFKIFVSDNYHWWFAFVATFESILLIRILRREALSFFDACFYFFFGGLFFNYFSMMRQWIAVIITFSGIYSIVERRFVSYLLICCVAGLFHPSAMLMIIAYFFVNGKPWRRKQFIVIVVFALIIVYLNPILESLNSFLDNSTYNYVLDSLQTNTGSSWVRIPISAVPVVLTYLYQGDDDDPVIELCTNMALLNMMLTIIATFTNGLYVIRFTTYTSIYNVILYPYILNIGIRNDENNRGIIRGMFYLFYVALFFYNMNHTGSFYYRSDILGTFY